MKKILGIILVIMMFAVGCSSAPSADDAPEQDEHTEQPVEKTAPPMAADDSDDEMPKEPSMPNTAPEADVGETVQEPESDGQEDVMEDTEEPAAVSEDPKVKSLLSVADKKVKSYVYNYNEPPLNAGADEWSVYGDKVKIRLDRSDFNMVTYDYNTIYLDKAEKKAVGYCFGSESECPDGEIMYTVDYEFWVRDTPHEWLDKIVAGVKGGSKTIDGRTVISVSYDDNGKTYEVWVEEYNGLPLRIDIFEDDEPVGAYNFAHMQYNTLKEDDMTPSSGYE